MNEIKADDLKCCGNCAYYSNYNNTVNDEYCNFIDSTNHPDVEFVFNWSPACRNWELDDEIWARIYNNIPKNAEPILIKSEDQYEKLFGKKSGIKYDFSINVMPLDINDKKS